MNTTTEAQLSTDLTAIRINTTKTNEYLFQLNESIKKMNQNLSKILEIMEEE